MEIRALFISYPLSNLCQPKILDYYYFQMQKKVKLQFIIEALENIIKTQFYKMKSSLDILAERCEHSETLQPVHHKL